MNKSEWNPTSFDDVAKLLSRDGGLPQRVKEVGFLPCPPPQTDPLGVYRVAPKRKGDGIEIQRLDQGSRMWWPIDPQAPGPRKKAAATSG